MNPAPAKKTRAPKKPKATKPANTSTPLSSRSNQRITKTLLSCTKKSTQGVVEEASKEVSDCKLTKVDSKDGFYEKKMNPFEQGDEVADFSVAPVKNKNICYVHSRYDANGVLGMESVPITQTKSGHGSSCFDSLVFRKYKKGEDPYTRVDAKGKITKRYGFGVGQVLAPELLNCLLAAQMDCVEERIFTLEEMVRSQPDEYGEYDCSTATETKYPSGKVYK